ncbi:MAG: hypothetical protein U9Q99_00420 [Nanoarchaeota archaeon]|nr:hypothetical protein [Nanoarchaeota archaeon]
MMMYKISQNSLKNSFVRFRSTFGYVRLKTPPKWVEKKAHHYYDSKRVRPYDKVIYFKGKNFKYKIFFKTICQGQIDIQYFAQKK